jgi:EamA domain-containing membrane protein RarD
VIADADDRRAQLVGLAYGASVHLCWGLAPLYWKLLRAVPPGELVAHRVVWSESMSALRLSSFACIWLGLTAFSFALWRRFRPARS